MSEEEYSEEEYEEEEEVEEEVEVEAEEAEAPEDRYDHAPRRAQHISESADNENLTEAEKAMQAAKKRQLEEDEAKLLDYEEKRRIERDREEEELRLLKEKQEQRRLQREEEEREASERRRLDEERRQKEEEERKARMEADRKKKEEEKLKRAQMMSGFAGAGGAGGRNFVIPEKKDKADKFGNIVQAKQEMGMTKEQQEDAKHAFLATIRKAIDLSGIPSSELKAKIKEMHVRICKLEAEKYDLEKRHERQTYDLKELNERQRQVTRNRNLQKGGDASDPTNGRYPPKIAVVNKYDRQIDRRNFSERRSMFEKKGAFPCFPNVPPPPTILEFKPMKESGGDNYQNEEVEEDYEDEEEEEE